MPVDLCIPLSKGGGGYHRAASLQIEIYNTYFIDMIISNVIHDVRFSRNQPLQSADG
jgi:hypothetical protein